MRRMMVLVSCAAIAVTMGACGGGDSNSSSSGPISIGFVGDLTGPVAPYSSASLAGVKVAVADVNAAGGIDGRKIELKVFDDTNKPVQTVNIAKRMAPNVSAAIVASGSANVLAAGPAFERAQIPWIVTVSSNPAVTNSQWKWVNRVHLSDADQVKAVLSYATTTMGLKRIAIIHDTSDLGRGGETLINAQLKAQGMPAVENQSYAPETNDFSTQINTLREAKPDGVIFWGTLDAGARIAEQMRSLGMGKVQFLGGGGLVSDQFVKLAGKASDGTVAAWAYVDPNNATYKAMAAKYQKATGNAPDIFGAQSYDGMRILVDALTKAGTDGPALQKAIRATKYTGAVGDLSFDATGQNIRTIHLGIVRGGKWTLLK